MKFHICAVAIISFLALVLSATAQTTTTNSPATSASVQVPPVIQFSNVATSEAGSPLTGTVSITFSLYNSAQGGESLWSETQNVTLDSAGHYSVYVGMTKPTGVPPTLFTNGEAHWLGVQIAGQAQQSRVFLVSVPYAMKAGDAATIGGLPPSAFVLAAPQNGNAAPSLDSAATQGVLPATATDVTTAGGTINTLPLFSTATDIENSVISQTGSGTTAKIGIGTVAPAATLDVRGSATVRGIFTLPAGGVATASAGKSSQPMNLVATAFSSTSIASVNQTFSWQAEPVTSSNDTADPTGALHLLFGSGTTKPSETGLNIASTGIITFATGQTFPGGGGGGSGTVTSVGSGLGLTGGPITGSGTLMIDTTVVPQLSAANTFTGNQTVTGSLSASGFNIGSNLFAFGTYANSNAFLGFAGNKSVTGIGNVGTGYQALLNDTSGFGNTAVGFLALAHNTAGNLNTAVGGDSGLTLDGSNLTTGSSNTFIGYNSKISTGTLSNDVAIGANAMVAENNAMVLGQINGVNGATVGTAVGIGTTTPQALLDVSTGSLDTFIGNPHCTGANFAGIAFAANSTGGFQNCQNYAMAGDGVNTWFAAPTGNMYFRVNKNAVTAMFVNSSGQVGVGTTAPGAQLEADATGSTVIGVSGSGSLGGVIGGSANFGLYGSSSGTSASSVGVYGQGLAGVQGIGSSYGSYSSTASGLAGSYGVFQGPSTTGSQPQYSICWVDCGDTFKPGPGVFATSAGVWADTNWDGDDEAEYIPALLATADANFAAVLINNSSVAPAALFYNQGSGGSYTGGFTPTDADVVRAVGSHGSCSLTGGGDTACTGTLKSVVATSGGAQHVETYSVQSAENWFEDAGTAQLVNGTASVNLESVFGKTVNAGVEYHVFLTPDGDCKGLYISAKTASGFQVRELGGGASSVAFEYRIMAKRVGYETVRLTDVTKRFSQQAALSKGMARPRKDGIRPSAMLNPRSPKPVIR